MKVTDNRASHAIRPVRAWAHLTPEEQAQHLVTDHGFDVDQFSTTEALMTMLPDNAAVAAAFIRSETDVAFREALDAAGKGNSIPWGMESWHVGDHNGDGTSVGGDFANSGLDGTVGLHIHAHAD